MSIDYSDRLRTHVNEKDLCERCDFQYIAHYQKSEDYEWCPDGLGQFTVLDILSLEIPRHMVRILMAYVQNDMTNYLDNLRPIESEESKEMRQYVFHQLKEILGEE